ncbi:ABC transporter ATP-binding protein [Hoeflea prorocentri]|uniref:ATP-binding cassette domain-containing protein n=1 Tax=Hoeflea prorocentri TaxID=1922333 RepID=A0A9X3ULT6_9HYPH|nr:ATP-binding cassette domain-containing protein [Hoeflea prorocentri]MCY6383597.1 ATP-binding cassette domain-containing protein [Hoeflea prorocentri]MDA5401397.1 ATP-binding cassette domain-containing protein [Hoeflea prorocentri]
MSAALQFENLTGGYGGVEILHGVSGEVRAGHVLGVFGRNGVGKTTLARMLTGSLPVASGSVLLSGRTVNDMAAFERRRAGLGYMPQTSMVFDGLTVLENLSMAGSSSRLAGLYELFPRMRERKDQNAGSMSGGERKIVAFTRTMLEDTDVIVLDEPSEGVQPENIAHMETFISRRRDEGCAIVLIEQNLNMLLGLADSFLGLDSGRIVYQGARKEVTREQLLDVLLV